MRNYNPEQKLSFEEFCRGYSLGESRFEKGVFCGSVSIWESESEFVAEWRFNVNAINPISPDTGKTNA